MKRSRYLALFITGVFITAGGLYFLPQFFRKDSLQSIPHAKEKFGSYFVSFEVNEFTHQSQPCLSVKIEDLTILLMLDLGSPGNLSLNEDVLNQLQTKTYRRLGKSQGLRGRSYEYKVYDLPKIQIGSVSFGDLLLCAETEGFLKDTIIANESVPAPIEKGRLGWYLFFTTNLFLDLGNKKVAVCDSLQTLGSNGYAIEDFIKVPLFLENKLIEIETEIGGKKLRSVLDTGSTWNLFNSVKEGGGALDDSAWALDAPIMTTSLSIGSQSFDSITWHLLPICLPFSVDAILGMDFFQTHLVFLDFSENMAYIAKLK